MSFLFEDLLVYQKAISIAHETGTLTEAFPKGNYYLSDQLNRAALSISTNIAEGNGRYNAADRRNFFRIARGSAFECVPILEICKRKTLIDDHRHAELKSKLEEICKMLSALIEVDWQKTRGSGSYGH